MLELPNREILLNSVIIIVGVNVWLTCTMRGFFYHRYRKVCDMLSLTVVYGCFPLLVATAIFISFFMKE
jgi:hypothetical protein